MNKQELELTEIIKNWLFNQQRPEMLVIQIIEWLKKDAN